MNKKRRICSFCSQELADTAFFRHQSDTTGTVCPGKRKRIVTISDDELTERESLENCKSPRNLDSTFDLGSSDSDDSISMHPYQYQCISPDKPLSDDSLFDISSDSSSDSCNSTTSSLDGEEVWEDDSVADETEQNINGPAGKITSGIFYFLALFQLLYHLSERAISSLLGIVRLLLHNVGVIFNHNALVEFAAALPKSMNTIRTTFKQNHHVEYVVCPKCNALYHLSECIIHENNGDRSKKCNHVEYPNHPHVSRRSPCNEILLKKVKVGCKYKLIARKVYIYQSIIHTLKEMARRKGFLDKCNEWRDCSRDTTFLGDIYDGKVWNDLKEIGGRPFLALPNNLCLGLNIDWFRLYEHSPYSAGAIYLVVLNLPRNELFKEENVILAGIIPGPHEPKNDINTFLSPLVDDLIELYSGISFENTSSLLGSTFIRATLACIICDLPATRKVCGFANFNGNYGCSKCTKQFPTTRFGDKPNYSGYNCANWTDRDISLHRSMADKYKKSPTASYRKKIIQQSGIKYCELLRIPHFDVIRLHIIDPMHNVFLGLAKHTIKTWKDNGVLNPNCFAQLQEKIDSIVPPTKIGRIPRKIDSNFSSFTADEWKNWILIYSMYCLSGIVDDPHYECWKLLVDSCILFCQFVITVSRGFNQRSKCF